MVCFPVSPVYPVYLCARSARASAAVGSASVSCERACPCGFNKEEKTEQISWRWKDMKPVLKRGAETGSSLSPEPAPGALEVRFCARVLLSLWAGSHTETRAGVCVVSVNEDWSVLTPRWAGDVLVWGFSEESSPLGFCLLQDFITFCSPRLMLRFTLIRA